MTGPIECTSLITRITTRVGALEGNFIPFIEGDRTYIDEAYLIQVHTLKKGLDDSLIFFFLGYTNEIPLPNAEFHLYNYHSLTIPLIPREGARRHRSSGLLGRMTRSRARRETEPTPLPQQPQHSHQLQRSLEPHQTDRLIPRFRCHHPAARWAAGAKRQHTRDTAPTYWDNPGIAASHWRKTPRHRAEATTAPRGLEGLLPLDGFQPRSAAVSLKLAWGIAPMRGNLYHLSLLLS